MSGHVVHYTYLQIIQPVLESRKQNARISNICIENNITPRILHYWQQMCANCKTEQLEELVGSMKPKEVVAMIVGND